MICHVTFPVDLFCSYVLGKHRIGAGLTVVVAQILIPRKEPELGCATIGPPSVRREVAIPGSNVATRWLAAPAHESSDLLRQADDSP